MAPTLAPGVCEKRGALAKQPLNAPGSESGAFRRCWSKLDERPEPGLVRGWAQTKQLWIVAMQLLAQAAAQPVHLLANHQAMALCCTLVAGDVWWVPSPGATVGTTNAFRAVWRLATGASKEENAVTLRATPDIQKIVVTNLFVNDRLLGWRQGGKFVVLFDPSAGKVSPEAIRSMVVKGPNGYAFEIF